MKKEIFKYLEAYSSNPKEVDKLIVSAFIETNDLKLKNNVFLKSYLIPKRKSVKREKLSKFIEILQIEIENFDIEKLIELFEFVISPSDRIINGAIYTPSDIREYIIAQSFRREGVEIGVVKIADIACGCSGFLYTASKELKKITGNSYQYIFQNQIFGLDIQKYSVIRSMILLSLLALLEGEDVENFNFNIFQGDTLTFNWNEHFTDFRGFQIIVGNPPYVCARNLEDTVKENMKNWTVCASGNPDLYIPFFQIGCESLSENGILSFITMNTFFKSLNGRALRHYFEEKRVAIRIVDFGTLQIFKSKSTYTCICFLENIQQNYVEYYKSTEKELPDNRNQYIRINYKNLDSKKGWNLNENEIISRIETTGTPFGEKYKTRHGIATLRNDLYIFKPIKEDDKFYYLQSDSLYPIEKGICKDILNSNKLSREINFNEVKEKLLFPYNDEIKPKAFEEETLKENFPYAYEYLRQKKEELAKRDKGKGKYEKWFAFGRTQSLEKVENKLFFPKFSDKVPSCLISNDANLLFYNGQAVVGHTENEMTLIKKIMESRLFWYYIKTTSKPYSSEYYSLDRNYIKNFGICQLTDSEMNFVLKEGNKNILDSFFADKYEVFVP